MLRFAMFHWMLATGAVAIGPALSQAQTAADKAGGAAYESQVVPFLAKHCLACHGPEKAKGDLRLDQLAPDFAVSANRDRWLAVAKRMKDGEMPPKAQPRPDAKDMAGVSAWIRENVVQAEIARRAEGRTPLRRLNRVEYENTVRDLFGIEVYLHDLLPMDDMAGGFDNVADGQHVSTFLMERYLEAAERVLDKAIVNGPKPASVKKRVYFTKERQAKQTGQDVFRKMGDTLVCFSSSDWHTITVGQAMLQERGTYRIRISAYAVQSDGKPVTFRMIAGGQGRSGTAHLVGYFDAPAGQPRIIEFTEHLEAKDTLRLLPYGLAPATKVHNIGSAAYKGPGLAIEWLELEGPLYDAWPPSSHQRIFGDLPQKSAPAVNQKQRVEVASQNPAADAERILRDVARRAFRRTVTDDELKPILNLVKARLAENYSFERAVRVGLMGILVSPNFLFLREEPGRLDDFALASRLSYFLWSSTPDEELLALAAQEKLSQPEVLREQVERLLKSPKSAAFTRNFVGQWLGLRDIEATMPSFRLYPEFDEMLRASMLRETYLFFDELLKNDMSVSNLIASDFSMLNGRLAKHYGIPGVDGWEFQKVKLPADSHRGGLLTMASVCRVTANGTYTSPILRGAWVLDRILGQAPPRPPEGVAGIEPDIRGATTIREQLAKHRQLASCAGCHAKIDPPGFALESFDVIGGWRDQYRTTGNGTPVEVEGKKANYRLGKKVDPSDVLPSGERFDHIDDYKRLLLKERDQIARNLAGRLATYATGCEPQTADQPAIEAILAKIRERDYGLRTLVHEVAQSKLFRNK